MLWGVREAVDGSVSPTQGCGAGAACRGPTLPCVRPLPRSPQPALDHRRRVSREEKRVGTARASVRRE